MKPLGIRVLIVEPGAFGTNFANRCTVPETPMPKDYDGTPLAQMMSWASSLGKDIKLPGDVDKGCKVIFDVVMKSGQAEGMEETIRLPLGNDCAVRWRAKIEEHQKTLQVTEKLWSATDVDDL